MRFVCGSLSISGASAQDMDSSTLSDDEVSETDDLDEPVSPSFSLAFVTHRDSTVIKADNFAELSISRISSISFVFDNVLFKSALIFFGAILSPGPGPGPGG